MVRRSSDREMSDRDGLRSAAVQFAVEGVRSLILINGGAAAGLATFATAKPGTPLDLHKIVFAMEYFAFGALLATLTFGLSYIAQIYAYELDISPNHPKAWIFNLWRAGAVVCSIVSSGLFVLGILAVGQSLP